MHQDFLHQAVELACFNVSNGGGPFGALIVRDQRIIAASGNRVTENMDPTAHAEVLAIRQACQYLQDFQLKHCVLYTSCEPCPMCLGAIYWSRLDAVYFASSRDDAAQAGFDDSLIYTEIDKPAEQRQIVMRHLPLESAAEPFRLWQIQTDKIRY
ncbi:nucleoside deaminase [Methylomonas sp. EFPC3]|uniref:nucleoside deaminase n=1 Tax=Methylomonas TaxID=416 RepID=UPI001127FF82|nr:MULTISPECIES: nucleoside deaminase [Methylomonas]TPQ29226.1 tRNA-specific adenosine deaminase [Methylomonas koyamae]WFP48684.1 nucleoside deaminase [Methylomonas sp. EFPC3]